LEKKRCDSEIETPETIVDGIISDLIDNLKPFKEVTYLNCDIRYQNLDFIVDKHGYFDIIAIDPPWRIRGG
jgi:hypothetical protein